MRFRSNLECPDLSAHFKLLSKPRPWSFGHDVPSDPDFLPDCCFFTVDEVSILYNVAKQIGGTWVDIGARTGWTAAHLMVAGCQVVAVDPEYRQPDFLRRTHDNLRDIEGYYLTVCETAAQFLDSRKETFDGFVIDGNHDFPEPSNDAKGCLRISNPDCVMVFHDLRGQPIRDAVRFLVNEGFASKEYVTPNGVAICWRGCPGFEAPEHVPDPLVRPA